MGYSNDRQIAGATVHMSLTPNPSHLEVVNPVVTGKVRGKQDIYGDVARREVLTLLVHGDAAFAGQGLVMETLMLSELKGYSVGGTVHIIINNQIGFTTLPDCSRSGPYSSDLAKMLGCPIFHVNGDDLEAVTSISRLAIEYRQTFGRDVVIDLICYRRNGHNEGDEPMFTQPIMYKTIKDKKNPFVRFMAANWLPKVCIAKPKQRPRWTHSWKQMEEAFESSKTYKVNKADWLEGKWAGLKPAYGDERRGATAITADAIKRLGDKLSSVPPTFNLNSKSRVNSKPRKT